MSERGNHVLLTLGKELRETLRDRRTVAVMVLFPLVVYPLLALLVSQVVATRERAREARPAKVAVVGAGAAADDLRRRVAEAPKTFSLLPDASGGDVEAGRADALALVKAGGVEAAGKVELVYDAARDDSREAADRLAELIGNALPKDCARYDIHRRDLASKTRLGGYILSKALPLALVLMVLLGAFYPAIDVTAGERERGTLETVLTAPVRRFDLLLGKVMAVSLIAAATGLLNLASMTVTLIQAVRLADAQALLPVPWTRAAASALVILPAAFLFSSAFVAVGTVARGFKEAQNLLMPVYFLSIAPALVGSAGDYPLSGAATIVPGMNVTLLARDLVLGDATWLGALLALGSTALYGALALTVAARVYDSERLVHPGERRPRGDGGAPGAGDATPTAGEALLAFALAFVLLYFLFVPLQRRAMVPGLLASQWLGMFGLVALLARARRRPLAAMIALHQPAPAPLVGGALVGATAWAAVALVSEWLVPVPREFIEQLRKALVSQGERPFLLNLLLVALTPAICEEVLFRGLILRGLATRLAPAAAAVVTGVLFGLFHLDLYRLLPSTTLGVLLSFLALWSRSIVPSMLAHFLNNALLLALATARIDEKLSALGGAAGAGLLTVSLLATGSGLWLARRGRQEGGV